MNTRFQSALSHIKADEVLISKTEVYLKDKLTKNQETEVNKLLKPRFINIRNLAKAACIVFMLTGGSTATYAFYKTPVSYLSLDINPSIEIGVNAFDRVVTAEGYNNDGKTVLKGLNITGRSVAEAVDTVISSAALNGFIDEDGSTVVSVTSETNSGKMAGKLESEAEKGVNKALKEKAKKAVVLKGNVSLAFRNEAIEQDITPGKLKLIKEVQAVNPSVTVDQYKNEKVKDIVNIIKDNKTTASNKEASAVKNKNASTANSKKSISNENYIDSNNSNIESVVVNKNTESSSEKAVCSTNEGNSINKNSDKNESSVNSKKGESENNDKNITSNNEIIKRHTKNTKIKNK